MLQHIQIMVLRVPPIYPCHAAIDLLCIRIYTGAFNPRDDALITVLHERGDFRLFAEAQIGERLFRPAAEWLGILRCINLGQAYLVLPLGCGQNGQRIPSAMPTTLPLKDAACAADR